MPYEPSERDLDEPRGERGYEQPDDEVVDLYEEWFHDSMELFQGTVIDYTDPLDPYDRALIALQENPISVSEAHGLLLMYEDEPQKVQQAGSFLSAVYNLAEEDTVFYDVGLPYTIRGLGKRLREEKTMVLEEPTYGPGFWARGLIINRSQIELGFNSLRLPGVFINTGEVETGVGESSPGTYINLGTIGTDFGKSREGNFFNMGTVNHQFGRDDSEYPNMSTVGRYNLGTVGNLEESNFERGSDELREYLEELQEGLEGSKDEVAEFLDSLGPVPRLTIKKDLAEVADSPTI